MRARREDLRKLGWSVGERDFVGDERIEGRIGEQVQRFLQAAAKAPARTPTRRDLANLGGLEP